MLRLTVSIRAAANSYCEAAYIGTTQKYILTAYRLADDMVMFNKFVKHSSKDYIKNYTLTEKDGNSLSA